MNEKEIVDNTNKIFLKLFDKEAGLQYKSEIYTSTKTGYPFSIEIINDDMFIFSYVFTGFAEFLSEAIKSIDIDNLYLNKIIKMLKRYGFVFNEEKMYGENITRVGRHYKKINLSKENDISKIDKLIEKDKKEIDEIIKAMENNVVNIKNEYQKFRKQLDVLLGKAGTFSHPKRHITGNW